MDDVKLHKKLNRAATGRARVIDKTEKRVEMLLNSLEPV